MGSVDMGNVQDVEVGQIRNQAHAAEVAAEYIRHHPEFVWTGQWNGTSIQIRKKEPSMDELLRSSSGSSHQRFPFSAEDPISGLVDLVGQSFQQNRPQVEQNVANLLDSSLNNVLSSVVGQSGPIGHGISTQPLVTNFFNALNDLEVASDSDDDDEVEQPPSNTTVHTNSTGQGTHRMASEAPYASGTQGYGTASGSSTIESSKKGFSSVPLCPVCWEEMKPPKRIFQCTNGHLVCEGCRNQPQLVKCPTCREPIMGRATAMEHFLAQLHIGASSET